MNAWWLPKGLYELHTNLYNHFKSYSRLILAIIPDLNPLKLSADRESMAVPPKSGWSAELRRCWWATVPATPFRRGADAWGLRLVGGEWWLRYSKGSMIRVWPCDDGGERPGRRRQKVIMAMKKSISMDISNRCRSTNCDNRFQKQHEKQKLN